MAGAGGVQSMAVFGPFYGAVSAMMKMLTRRDYVCGKV
jgi:hypothetical protein